MARSNKIPKFEYITEGFERVFKSRNENVNNNVIAVKSNDSINDIIELSTEILAELKMPDWIENYYFSETKVNKDEQIYYFNKPGSRTLLSRAGKTIENIILYCSLVKCWPPKKIVKFLQDNFTIKDNHILRKLCELKDITKPDQYSFVTSLARYKRYYSKHLNSFLNEVVKDIRIRLWDNPNKNISDLVKTCAIDLDKALNIFKANNVRFIKTEEKPSVVKEIIKNSKLKSVNKVDIYNRKYNNSILYINNNNILFSDNHLARFIMGNFTDDELCKYSTYLIYKNMNENSIPDIFKPKESFGAATRNLDYAIWEDFSNIKKESLLKYHKLIVQGLCEGYSPIIIYAFLCVYDPIFKRENNSFDNFRNHINQCIIPYYSVNLDKLLRIKNMKNHMCPTPSSDDSYEIINWHLFTNNIDKIFELQRNEILNIIKSCSKAKSKSKKNSNIIRENRTNNICKNIMHLFMNTIPKEWSNISFENKLKEIIEA